MKRILEFLIIITFVMVLVGCGAKTRKDDFFSKEELKNLYLEDLPKINYSTSVLKIYVGTLEGYFNVKKEDFTSYTEEVLDYFKDTDYTYGGVIPGTTVSLAGAFPRSDWMMYNHACLYEKEHNLFIFIYRPSGNDNDYRILFEYGSFTEKGNSYNTKISIRSFSAGTYVSKDNYLEIELTKDYLEENKLLNIYHKEYTFDNGIKEFLYISLDIVPIIGMVDIEVETMYRGNKEKVNLTIDPYYPNSSQSNHYYDIIKPYTERDLQILDYIIKNGVIVVEKDSGN